MRLKTNTTLTTVNYIKNFNLEHADSMVESRICPMKNGETLRCDVAVECTIEVEDTSRNLEQTKTIKPPFISAILNTTYRYPSKEKKSKIVITKNTGKTQKCTFTNGITTVRAIQMERSKSTVTMKGRSKIRNT